MTALELARAIYDRQRQSPFGRHDRPMPPWEQIPLAARQARVKNAQQLQQAYHRLDAREVPLRSESPPR